ncbi:MAG TPA: Rne/Rng family ribonuclease [Stellaceae bacterium]
MAKRMLIDATHPEETRVVVLNGNRLEEFDFETSTKKQVKGNIYLAKVTRVEPSLQAAFVEYGGNRHGFLAFSEIHSDYYRIPVADRREVTTGFHPAELARLEANGDAADEGGVPLDQALPEPVAVIETDLQGDDDPGDDEAFNEPAFSAWNQETPNPVERAEDEAPRPTVGEEQFSPDAPGANEWPAEQPAARVSRDQEASSDHPAEPPAQPPAPEAARPEPAPTPPPTWFAASAGDEVVVAPEIRPDEPGAGRSIGVAADPDMDAGGQDHDAPKIVETSHTADGEPGVSESDKERDPDRENRERDIFERRPFAGPEGAESEDFERAAWADHDDSHSNVVEMDAHEDGERAERDPSEARHIANVDGPESEVIETLGGDEFEEVETQRSRVHRHYKIQEVIKRRQIMLVQVTKEERGNKGAALTTYLSLAGRYCVLMPNTARGGGVSRKITNPADRRRLKEILEELDIPEGMGVIVRTAGAERSKAEIKRDYEYLLRLWNEIRELTLRSTAPALIYEEGDLIKRSIRDLYTRDIDEVLVEGEEGYRTAKAFMKMLMPSHAKRVQPYRDPQIGLLHRFQVESQIDAIHSPVVQLRSGGYVVIDQTEALVAIDVNSGRATRERNIEETALRTNLEAAEEIARQLRLRDLAGLIVIDFIDMEEHRNQGAVERRLKEALRNDRARIQVGRISPFGLLEMSRQRLRSSLAEVSTQPCPHCGGTGFIRSTESTALYVLRSIEEEGMRRRSAEVCVYVPTTVALYILNHKRDSLAQLETRYGIHVLVARDDSLIPPAFRLDRLRAFEPGETPIAASPPLTQSVELEADDAGEDLDEEAGETEDADQPTADGDGEEERGRARRRRRRRRRHDDDRSRAAGGGDDDGEEPAAAAAAIATAGLPQDDGDQEGEEDGESGRLRRRRGRRGGRRRVRREEGVGPGGDIGQAAADTVEIVPADAAPPVNGALAPDEDATAVPASPDWWSPAAASDSSTALTATAIETASLPAIAGEASPAKPSSTETLPVTGEAAPPLPDEVAPAGNGALPAPDAVAPAGSEGPHAPDAVAPAGNEAPPPASPRTEMSGYGENPNGEDVSGTDFAQASEPGPSDQTDAAPANTEPAAKPVAEEPPPSETQPSATLEYTSTQLVEEVKEKPENPRRGWWQRLIQS